MLKNKIKNHFEKKAQWQSREKERAMRNSLLMNCNSDKH